MSPQPSPRSGRPAPKTDLLLDTLRRLGTARTNALSEATGIPCKQIPHMLETAIARGEVQVCKVTVPGSAPQNEYRLGSGVPVPAFVPLKTGRRVELTGSASAGKPPAPAADPADRIVHPFMMTAMPTPACAVTVRPGEAKAAKEAAPAASATLAAPATSASASLPPVAEGDLIERVGKMTAVEFGEFVGFLSRVWSWKAGLRT